MLILPAIDLIDGRTVRLTQGDYNRKTDYGLDPISVAIDFEEQGAEWLHLVDLDGAKAGHPQNLATLKAIARSTSLQIEFGGGMRELADIEAALEAGADRVIVGSRLARDREFAQEVFETFGDKIVAGIDTRNGFVATNGWIDTADMKGTDLARELVKVGCQRVITTDIAKDGLLKGPDLEGLAAMVAAVSVPVIASGGVSSLEDLSALLALPSPGVEGVIVGKALYEGRFSLSEAVRR